MGGGGGLKRRSQSLFAQRSNKPLVTVPHSISSATTPSFFHTLLPTRHVTQSLVYVGRVPVDRFGQRPAVSLPHPLHAHLRGMHPGVLSAGSLAVSLPYIATIV